MRDAYLICIVMNIIKFQIRLIKMKKRLALAAAFAFSIIPFTSFADHLEPDESEIKKGGEFISTKLEDYDLFSNNLSDDILIAFEGIEGCGYSMNGYCIKPGADLSDADLSGANLSGANLRGTDLRDITASNLRGCPSSLPSGWFCENNSLIQR
mgnify:CR=1 FL=1